VISVTKTSSSSLDEEAKMIEARKIIDRARNRGIILRMIGGLAVRYHCKIVHFCEREYVDIDMVGLHKQIGQITLLFEQLGYREDKNRFLESGGYQTEFYKDSTKEHVDVLLDIFRMDHDINLRDRLMIEDYTISVSDLLLSKLQIFRINEKDIRDILTIVKDLPISEEDKKGTINVDYIAKLCANDWGLYQDVSANIDKCAHLIRVYNLTAQETEITANKLNEIKERIETAPKTFKWKARGKIGKRKSWRRDIEDQEARKTEIQEELQKRETKLK
jgi:hypothetical protein